jgi:hypothetical protein
MHEICNNSLKNSLHYAVLVACIRMVKSFLYMRHSKVKCKTDGQLSIYYVYYMYLTLNIFGEKRDYVVIF